MTDENKDTPEMIEARATQPKKKKDDEFIEEFDALIERARAAGVRPLKVMAASYIKLGLDMFDGIMDALEEGSGKKKRAERKKKAP